MIDLKGGWDADGEAAAPDEKSGEELLGSGSRYRLKSGSAIVPRESVSGRALSAVIAIMAFLACLSLGAVALVGDTAAGWQRQVSREATIQIRPSDKAEMDDTVRAASRLVLGFEGISRITALDDAASARLLEPWLGANADLSELPVPRLLRITVKEGATPDYDAIRAALAEKVPGAQLDDHGAWLDRLNRMAWTTVVFGTAILAMVLGATALTVVFATHGAMAECRDIIDVLHFVGATPGYVAGQFQRHFLTLSARGAIAGGVMSVLVFAALGFWTAWSSETPQGNQVRALFGAFTLGPRGYLGIAGIVLVVILLAA
ncbi:MAG: ABC transporter permease, partial [Pseudomonadota bacterium]|nr:ABC transporter permease [Pseudomonadota bacterium]